MRTKIKRPNKEELKTLFKTQCEPCQLDNKNCEGNIDKAKKWKCPRFFNGFMVM